MSSSKFGTFRCALAGVAALLGLMSPDARAQEDYPTDTVTFLVPYSAGGAPDFMGRVFAERLQSQIGQPVVVDNRPGSNGSVAASALANARADGYTFLVTDGSMMSINPYLYPKLSYDPANDFVPVSLMGTAPTYLAVHPDVPVSTFQEFIDYAKSPATQFNYGSSGIGSPHHLSMEALVLQYGLKVTHIPYRGSGQSVPALLSGEVSAVFASYAAIADYAKSGRVKILATNNLARTAEAPDVPAISEFVPNFDFASRMGLVARAGTPQALIDRMAGEIAAAAKDPKVVERLAASGVIAVGSSSAEHAKTISDENKRVGDVIQAAGIKPQG